MKYYFNVSDLILTCTNTRRTIVSDSVNLHIAKFKFDSMWDSVGKTATFTNSKTGISRNQVIDLDQCTIPWEVLEATQDGGYLLVCVTGVSGDVSFPTKMDMAYPLAILLKTNDDGVPAQPPTPNVYDQIMTEFANRYVDAIYEPKTILTTDWYVLSEILTITPDFTTSIVYGSTVIMRTANIQDYLDRTSYPYQDFYIDYSLDGISAPTRIFATSESGNSPSLRKIIFTIVGNTYEVRISPTQITIRRTSGTTDYYIHALLLRFDDVWETHYEIDGLTTSYKSSIFIENESKEIVRKYATNQYPFLYNGYIRLTASQLPTANIKTRFFGFKTDEIFTNSELLNIYGNAVFTNVSDEPISDLVTTHDNDLATIGQIKEYINSKIV